jgi:hypothetical protein
MRLESWCRQSLMVLVGAEGMRLKPPSHFFQWILRVRGRNAVYQQDPQFAIGKTGA